MYSIIIPTVNWFEYQIWLAQNYMYPMAEYFVYPNTYSTMTIVFYNQENKEKFENRWKKTFSIE